MSAPLLGQETDARELPEQTFYQLFDAAPDALLVVDATGLIRFVNTQTETLFGYAREELLGGTIELLVPERFREGHGRLRAGFARQPALRAMGSGLELHGRRRDGSEFPVEISLSPIATPEGAFVSAAVRDISERKRAEHVRSWLASIVDSSEDAIISTTLAGEITSWNRAAERIFGYRAEEAIGRALTLLLPDKGEREGDETLARVRRGESVSNLETVRRHKDGRELEISVTMSPIRDPHGALIGASKIARDITAQKHAERRARLASQWLLSAVESIQGMFALFDAHDGLVLCNSEFRQLFAAGISGPAVGQSFSAILDASLAEFDPLQDSPAELRARWLAYHRQPSGTLDLRTRDQRALRVTERATAEQGRVLTIWDITDDVVREDELRKARVQADTANAAKSEFLASMSHELRTPLNAILGFAQLLQRDRRTPLSERQREKTDYILKGGEHLLRLIDDVLDLARIEAGRVTISIEPVWVSEVLAEVARTLEPMATRAGVSLSLPAVPGELDEVLADRTRFAQVLMNFGSNAIKYGRSPGTVSFVLERAESGLLRVGVRDQGQGIAPDKQEKLFQPFQRAGQELGPIEGTGIGLTICKRLAELMSGVVGFRSLLGVGSEFWIELPLHRPAEEHRSLPRASAEPAAQTAVAGGLLPTIVYVEDNPSNIAFMRELLSEFDGVALITAPDAEVGIEIVRSRRPDVVIMDINLPGMNGIEAARRLRDFPETRDIPVVALSAAAMKSDRQRAEAAVFHRYLTKPVKVDELMETLEALLGTKP